MLMFSRQTVLRLVKSSSKVKVASFNAELLSITTL